MTLRVFFCISAAGFLFSLLWWLSGYGSVDASVLDHESLFSDYYFHMALSSDPKHLYAISSESLFPPLAYCFYWLLWRINAFSGLDPLDWHTLRATTNFTLVYVMRSIVIALLLYLCVRKYLEKYREGTGLVMALMVLFSYPFFATSFQRGNSVLPLCIMLCIAFRWKDSESKVKRELALILIAAAAAIKIYPAIAGFLYLYEKRYKEALRLLLYGIILFFGPFVFFGGLEGLKIFITKIITKERGSSMPGWQSLRSLMFMILPESISPPTMVRISFVVENLFLPASLWAAWITKRQWERFLFLGIIMVCYVKINFMYTLVCLLPAFLMLLRETREEKRPGWQALLGAVLFGIVFSLHSWMLYVFADGMISGSYLVMYVCWVVLFAGVFTEKTIQRHARVTDGKTHDSVI
ncbi:MAG: DUF2029 domain-containing protein [Lachnospiraceae bacterium]|nr:DUF2029 domain-containing protein [Lachnospiraceae bacterium]